MSSRIFQGLLAVIVAAALYLSDRTWNLASTPHIDEAAVLPDAPRWAA